MKGTKSIIRSEWPALFVWATAALWFVHGKGWATGFGSIWPALGSLVWICGAILFAAFAVVRHADVLAERFGEPYGTLILTLAVISLEVLMIAALMIQGNQPTLARDTMYSVVMIVLTALLGLCLLLGGIRFHEQSFNLQGANSFLAMILPLATVGLVLPNFTRSGEQSVFATHHAVALVVLSICIYVVFLLVQTSRYKNFFRHSHDEENAHAKAGGQDDVHSARPSWLHAILLVVYIAPVVVLAKILALILHDVNARVGLPGAFGGLVVAALLLAPEGLAAVEAALKNQLQRSVNILLGSVLATIGLTIPAALAIGLFTGREVVLGLPSAEVTLLMIIQGLCILTFGQGRTNMLQGAVHLLMFGVYLFLIFDTAG